ncbi:MAG: protein kinase [Nannocystis sp.]|nr:protein kinase [Nannocystis sp.]
MAPELAAGSRLAQAASDLFSFGVLAYELLTGDLPFSEPPILQVIANKGVLTCEPLAKRCPDLHPALIAALERCLAVDPATRPTAHDLASALGA